MLRLRSTWELVEYTERLPFRALVYPFGNGLQMESEVLPTPDAITPTSHALLSRSRFLPLPASAASPAPIEEIRSASTERLTSESLTELKRVIQTAYEEHEDISRELGDSPARKQEAQDKYQAWENGFLFKKMFKKSFAKRKADLDTCRRKS